MVQSQKKTRYDMRKEKKIMNELEHKHKKKAKVDATDD